MSDKTATRARILRLLMEHRDRPLSGEELGRSLGISRTAVWKHIHKLRASGYAVESLGKRGYRLKGKPDSLRHEEVFPFLETSWIGKVYEHHDRLGSTNDRAFQLAREGAPAGTVVVAEEQWAGRGRLQREWRSARKKGIYVSLVLRPELPPRHGPETTLLAALALVRCLRKRWELDALIKWPNDVLIQGKKVAGILTEMQSDPDRIKHLVVGVGINVHHGPEDLGSDLLYPATSLGMELRKKQEGERAPLTRGRVLAGFLNEMEGIYEKYLKEGFPVFIPDFRSFSAVLGRHILLQVGKERIEGKAVDFSAEGALLVKDREGRLHSCWVGDITRLRPYSRPNGPENPKDG